MHLRNDVLVECSCKSNEISFLFCKSIFIILNDILSSYTGSQLALFYLSKIIHELQKVNVFLLLEMKTKRHIHFETLIDTNNSVDFSSFKCKKNVYNWFQRETIFSISTISIYVNKCCMKTASNERSCGPG